MVILFFTIGGIGAILFSVLSCWSFYHMERIRREMEAERHRLWIEAVQEIARHYDAVRLT